jgi:hypothetical protein
MTSKGVSFHPSPGGQFSAVVDTSPVMAGHVPTNQHGGTTLTTSDHESFSDIA